MKTGRIVFLHRSFCLVLCRQHNIFRAVAYRVVKMWDAAKFRLFFRLSPRLLCVSTQPTSRTSAGQAWTEEARSTRPSKRRERMLCGRLAVSPGLSSPPSLTNLVVLPIAYLAHMPRTALLRWPYPRPLRAAPRNRVLRRLATTAVLQAVPILLPGRLTCSYCFHAHAKRFRLWSASCRMRGRWPRPSLLVLP